MPRSRRDHGALGSRIEAPEECVGFEVQDPLGQRVGSVEKVFVNGNGEAEYVRVKIGRFARKSVLLPAHLVAVDRERQILKLG